jgi:hypothetical protein
MNRGGCRKGFAPDYWNGGRNSSVAVAGRREFQYGILRAPDVGLTGADDETLLAWAADQNRVLLTHDVSTLTAYAYAGS